MPSSKGGHQKSGKSSKAGFACHRSDFIEKIAFLLERQYNLRQKSSIGVVTVGAQRWLKSRSFRWPWTGMSGELRPRHLPEWHERFERSARAGRGCVRRVWWGGDGFNNVFLLDPRSAGLLQMSTFDTPSVNVRHVARD